MEQTEEDRGQWGSRIGFILAAIGSAIGLGNIWRFPYMAYENGGGAFLIPYFFALLTAGIPLLIMEIGLGHKMRGSAPVSFKKLKDKYEVVGWWSVVAAFIIMVYYSVIMGWALNFIFFAFDQAWGANPASFFMKDFLGATGFWNLGGIKLNILASLAAIWGICYGIVYKGVEAGIEKASKVFMPILAVLMVLITIRGVTLPGAVKGLNHFLEPDFSALTNPRVWISAYGQVFFTLSLGFGIMINYASYLPKKSDVVNNAFITAFANSGFSFLAGLGVFSILGYMAQAQQVAFDKVVADGVGLAFITFPQAINLLPGLKIVFGVLFFVSLVISGISSGISLIDSFSSAIRDKFNISRKKAVNLVCGVGFLGGIIYTTGMGINILSVVDRFINDFGLALVVFVEALLAGYFFSLASLRQHVNKVSDFEVGNWWKIAVKYITVIFLGITIFMNFARHLTSLFGGYPLSAILILGWGTAAIAVVIAYIIKKQSWEKELPQHIVEEEK